MNRKFFGAALILFSLFLFGRTGLQAGPPEYILEVRDPRGERSLLQLGVPDGELIQIRTIHSLALTPYTHIYKFDEEGNLILSTAIFESGGGGFPEKGDGVWSVVEGKFHVDQINRFVGKLRFRVSPVSRETLILSGREFPLYRMVPEGTLIELKVGRKRSPF